MNNKDVGLEIPFKKVNINRTYRLNPDAYVREHTTKTQIVIHHTVGGNNISSLVDYWNGQKERVATHFVIDRQGNIYELFPIENWAYHLGVNSSQFRKQFPFASQTLEKNSIGIELMNYGPIIQKKSFLRKDYISKVYQNIRFEVDKQVYFLEKEWRGETMFENYTTEQLGSLHYLIRWILNNPMKTVKIEQKNVTFELSVEAIKGLPGIYFHCNYRSDKTDPYPHNILYEMIKQLVTSSGLSIPL